MHAAQKRKKYSSPCWSCSRRLLGLCSQNLCVTLKSCYTTLTTVCSTLLWIGLKYTFLALHSGQFFLGVGGYSSHLAQRSLWWAPLEMLEVCHKPFSRVDSCWAVKVLKGSVTGLPVEQHPQPGSRFDGFESFNTTFHRLYLTTSSLWRHSCGLEREGRQHYSCLFYSKVSAWCCWNNHRWIALHCIALSG